MLSNLGLGSLPRDLDKSGVFFGNSYSIGHSRVSELCHFDLRLRDPSVKVVSLRHSLEPFEHLSKDNIHLLSS